jgi:hypothetical protein
VNYLKTKCNEKRADMDYQLKICLGDSSEEYCNPTTRQIDAAVDTMSESREHFIIIDSKPPLHNCNYIQAAISLKDDSALGSDSYLEYVIEAQFRSGKSLRQYSKLTVDINNVKRILRMYSLGVVPSVDEWEDITEDIFPSVGKDYE